MAIKGAYGEGPNIVSDGAAINTVYVKREMRALAITEHELEYVSSLNTQSVVFFSVASGCITLAASICITAAFVENITPFGHAVLVVVTPLAAVLSAVFFGLGRSALKGRKTRLGRIMDESDLPSDG